jgi:ADP-ribose pyrophosphatase YjhB (NUDIX family)
MHILKTHYHTEVTDIENKTTFTRLATRAIAVKGNNILLLYTKRYEDKIAGMKRELIEETGAKNINNIKPFGAYEEYRPWRKADFDVQHMISYCYTCDIDTELGVCNMESHEIKNGMHPVWVNIYDAIIHNKKTISTSDKKGMSIERETFLLELIAKDLLA